MREMVYVKYKLRCGCGREIAALSAATIVGPGTFVCVGCALGRRWPCFKCGTETARAGCHDDELRHDPNLPFRPICDDCGPQWTLVAPLNEAARQSDLKPGDVVPVRREY